MTPRSVYRNATPTEKITVKNGMKRSLEKADKERIIAKRKERRLEEQLRSRHCRPLLKLFKMMGTDAFMAEFNEED